MSEKNPPRGADPLGGGQPPGTRGRQEKQDPNEPAVDTAPGPNITTPADAQRVAGQEADQEDSE